MTFAGKAFAAVAVVTNTSRGFRGLRYGDLSSAFNPAHRLCIQRGSYRDEVKENQPAYFHKW